MDADDEADRDVEGNVEVPCDDEVLGWVKRGVSDEGREERVERREAKWDENDDGGIDDDDDEEGVRAKAAWS